MLDRCDVNLYFMNGEFEKIVEIEKRTGSDSKLDSIYLAAHLFLGDIRTVYNKAEAIVNLKNGADSHNSEVKETAKNWLQRLKQAGFDNLNIKEPYDFTQKQSVENNCEEYPELTQINRIYQMRNKDAFQRYMDDINRMSSSINYKERALASFLTAEILILNKDYKSAVSTYISAINENPNIGLYWGYCSQVLNTHLNFDPFMSLYFIQNAINLDPKNPRWSFIKGQIISKIIFFEADNEWKFKSWLRQYEKEMSAALVKCHSEQVALKQAILLFVNMLDKKFNNASNILANG